MVWRSKLEKQETIYVWSQLFCHIWSCMGQAEALFYNGVQVSPRGRFVQVKSALTSVGVDASKYSGHSFRIGAATTAGLEDTLIQTLGRWKSAAYLLYIRLPPSQLAEVSASLSRCEVFIRLWYYIIYYNSFSFFFFGFLNILFGCFILIIYSSDGASMSHPRSRTCNWLWKISLDHLASGRGEGKYTMWGCGLGMRIYSWNLHL